MSELVVINAENLKSESIVGILNLFQPESQTLSLDLPNGEKIEMGVRLMTVTPEIASILISRNCNNRTLSKDSIKRLSKELELGNWVVSGESIKFDINGKLTDGQHRLSAIIKTGISVPLLIQTGLSEKAFAVIDSGKIRNAADALSIQNVSNNKVVSSAIKYLGNFKDSVYTLNSDNTKYSNQEVLDFYYKNPIIGESVEFGIEMNKISKEFMSLYAGVISALHYLLAPSYKKEAEEFFECVCGGENIKKNTAQYAIRNILLKDKASISNLSTSSKVKLLIVAWNKHIENIPLSYIRMPKFTSVKLQTKRKKE